MQPKLLNRKQREWAYDRWCEGYTHQEIADALFCCRKTIARALRGRPRIRPILEYNWEAENAKQTR